MYTTALLVSVAALVAPVVIAQPASASASASCSYVRHYVKGNCPGVRPTISVRAECQEMRANQPAMWRTDKVCAVVDGYRVKRGDTLWRISTRYCATPHRWRIIARANHLHGSRIYAGQVLQIPCVVG